MLDPVINLIWWEVVSHALFMWSFVVIVICLLGCWLTNYFQTPIPFASFLGVGFLAVVTLTIAAAIKFLIWVEAWPFIPS